MQHTLENLASVVTFLLLDELPVIFVVVVDVADFVVVDEIFVLGEVSCSSLVVVVVGIAVVKLVGRSAVVIAALVVGFLHLAKGFVPTAK